MNDKGDYDFWDATPEGDVYRALNVVFEKGWAFDMEVLKKQGYPVYEWINKGICEIIDTVKPSDREMESEIEECDQNVGIKLEIDDKNPDKNLSPFSIKLRDAKWIRFVKQYDYVDPAGHSRIVRMDEAIADIDNKTCESCMGKSAQWFVDEGYAVWVDKAQEPLKENIKQDKKKIEIIPDKETAIKENKKLAKLREKKKWYCCRCGATIPSKINRKRDKYDNVKGKCPSCKRIAVFINYYPTPENIKKREEKEEKKKQARQLKKETEEAIEEEKKRIKETPKKITPSKITAKLEGKYVEVTGRIIAEKRKKAIPKKISWNCRACKDDECTVELPVYNNEDFIFRGKHSIKGILVKTSKDIDNFINVDCRRKKQKEAFVPPWFGTIIEYDDFNLLWLADRLEDQDDFKASENKMKVALLGTESPIGRIVQAKGVVVVDPYSADLVLLGGEINEVETTAENLVLDEKMKNEFTRHFKDKSTEILNQIAPDMIGHDMVRMSRLLLLHSPVWIRDLNDRIIRGTIREVLFGDTKTDKSGSIKDVIKKYRFGEWCDAETGSRAGILFHVDTEKGAITWGVLPLNDRGYVGIESINMLNAQQWAMFREVLEDQRIKVTMAVQGAANVRTRISATMNPPKVMGDYLCKCQAITDTFIFKNPPDITRWDIWLPFDTDDVNQDEIIDRGKRKRPIPDDVFSTHILWAWNFSPDDITYEDIAKKLIKNKTKEVIKEYSVNSIPIVHSATRDTITRISVAMAILNHSTEDCRTVVVREQDVESAVNFYINMLEGINLRTYKNMNESETYVGTDELSTVVNEFEPEHVKILNAVMIRPQSSANLSKKIGVSEKTIKRKYELLKNYDLIKTTRGHGITLSRKGIYFIKKIQRMKSGGKTEKTSTTVARDTDVPMSLAKNHLHLKEIVNNNIATKLSNYADNIDHVLYDHLLHNKKIYQTIGPLVKEIKDDSRLLPILESIYAIVANGTSEEIENVAGQIESICEEVKKDFKKKGRCFFARDKGTSESLTTEVELKAKKTDDDLLLSKITKLMQTKSRHDWKINDICDGLGIAGLPGRKNIRSILWDNTSDPKNSTPIRRVDEKGLFWRLMEDKK